MIWCKVLWIVFISGRSSWRNNFITLYSCRSKVFFHPAALMSGYKEKFPTKIHFFALSVVLMQTICQSFLGDYKVFDFLHMFLCPEAKNLTAFSCIWLFIVTTKWNTYSWFKQQYCSFNLTLDKTEEIHYLYLCHRKTVFCRVPVPHLRIC